jgi:hypothetical protein
MGEFILILVISAFGYTTSQAILFPSKDACEAAKVQAPSLGQTRAVCVPRGTP